MSTAKTSPQTMRLGLHTYSLYLHGIGQAWAGFELPWERQLSTFELFDLGLELGLDGFHLDDGVLENLEGTYLKEVGATAAEKGLYLEYNLSLDLGGFGIGIQHDLAAGLETARAIGADVLKIGMEIPRPRPRAGSRFHPKVRPYLEETVERLQQRRPRRNRMPFAWPLRTIATASQKRSCGFSNRSTIRLSAPV